MPFSTSPTHQDRSINATSTSHAHLSIALSVTSCNLSPDQLANMLPTSTAQTHSHAQPQASTRRRHSTCIRCSSISPPSSPRSLKARLCHLTVSHSAATSQKHCFCPAATPSLTRSTSIKTKTYQIPTPPNSLRASLSSRPDSTMNRTSWGSSMSTATCIATQTQSGVFTAESERITRSSRWGSASTTRQPTGAMLGERQNQRLDHTYQRLAQRGREERLS